MKVVDGCVLLRPLPQPPGRPRANARGSSPGQARQQSASRTDAATSRTRPQETDTSG